VNAAVYSPSERASADQPQLAKLPSTIRYFIFSFFPCGEAAKIPPLFLLPQSGNIFNE